MKKIIMEGNVKETEKFIELQLREEDEREKNVFDNIDSILMERIERYTKLHPDYRFWTKLELENYEVSLFKNVYEIWFDSNRRILKDAIISRKASNFDMYDTIAFLRELDAIISYVEPRFEFVVEFPPKNKDKNSILLAEEILQEEAKLDSNLQSDQSEKVRLRTDDYASQVNLGEERFLRKKIIAVLDRNKAIVLEELPQKDRKLNKRWKLSPKQIYIKLFREELSIKRASIERYIKKYRSEKKEA